MTPPHICVMPLVASLFLMIKENRIAGAMGYTYPMTPTEIVSSKSNDSTGIVYGTLTLGVSGKRISRQSHCPNMPLWW